MKNFFERIGATIPHISMISSLMLIVFYVIDIFNKYMRFMSHKYTTIVVMVLAVTSFIGSIMLIFYQRREAKRFNRKLERKASRMKEREYDD